MIISKRRSNQDIEFVDTNECSSPILSTAKLLHEERAPTCWISTRVHVDAKHGTSDNLHLSSKRHGSFS